MIDTKPIVKALKGMGSGERDDPAAWRSVVLRSDGSALQLYDLMSHRVETVLCDAPEGRI